MPQNRERVYIAGTLDRDHGIAWPEPVPMAPFEQFINWTREVMPPVMKRARERFEYSGLWVINQNGFIHKKSAKQYRSAKSGRGGCWCPCLCASNRYWVVPLHREMTGGECLRLQGFDPAALNGLTNSEKRRRAGNSMTVPLVAAVLRGLGI